MAQIREKRDLAGGVKAEKPDSAGKNTVSKWSSYITAEDEDEDHRTSKSIEKRKDGEDHLLQLWMNDERLEEDIHPDFLWKFIHIQQVKHPVCYYLLILNHFWNMMWALLLSGWVNDATNEVKSRIVNQ